MPRKTHEDREAKIAGMHDLMAACARLLKAGKPAIRRKGDGLYGNIYLWARDCGMAPSTAIRYVRTTIQPEWSSYTPRLGFPLDPDALARWMRLAGVSEWPELHAGLVEHTCDRPERGQTESERVAIEALETAITRLVSGQLSPIKRCAGGMLRFHVGEGGRLHNQDPGWVGRGIKILGLWAPGRKHSRWSTMGRPLNPRAFLDWVAAHPSMDLREVARALRELAVTPYPRIGRPPADDTDALFDVWYAERLKERGPMTDEQDQEFRCQVMDEFMRMRNLS